MPEGCLLAQAGHQLEYLTGGKVLAGFHEVVTVPEMREGIVQACLEGRRAVRCSSTVFLHAASDRYLYPRGRFANKRATKRYPRTTAGHFSLDELKAIGLLGTVAKYTFSSLRGATRRSNLSKHWGLPRPFGARNDDDVIWRQSLLKN